MINLLEKKKNLETILRTKIQEFQNLENQKNNLANEILKLQGQIDLLNELEKDKEIKEPENKVEKT